MNPGRTTQALLLVAAPLPALAMGLLVMARAQIGPGLWAQNLLAGLLGIGLCLAAGARGNSGAHSARWLVLCGVLLLGATLISPGIQGVHRWLPVGPLRLHAAALLLPGMLVLLGQLPGRITIPAGLVIAALLFAQPDLAQALGFAVGWSLLAAGRHGRLGFVSGGLAIAMALATALRADPLEPVAHVEGIVGLATGQAAWLGAIGVVCLILLPLAWLTAADLPGGLAVAAYLAATLVAAWAGDFPVPVLGYGVSPILGYYLGAAAALGYRAERTSAMEVREGSRTA